MTNETIGITGGTGFVGIHLAEKLQAEGYKVIIFTRNNKHTGHTPSLGFSYWNPYEGKCDLRRLKELKAVVHLAGAGVAEKRWTKKRKQLILDSRVKTTQFMVEQLKAHAPLCTSFIAASAIGFYGNDNGNIAGFKEEARPSTDFLADVCRQWEQASEPVAETIRRVVFRFGIVLGKEGGAVPEFLFPMKFGIVPILGNGKQVMSWIEVNDLSNMILKAIRDERMNGIYNAVAPNPVTQKELVTALAKAKGGIKIPFPVPAPLLKIGLGEMSTEVLKSCTVSAEKILQTGFQFKHERVKDAINAVVNSK